MTKYVKKKKLSEIKDGDRVDDIFVVKFKKGVRSYQRGFVFTLTISDASNRNVEYKYWGGTDETRVRSVYNSIKADSIVHVQGKAATYQGELQITTNEPDVIEALAEGEFDPGEFIKPSKKDIEKMYRELIAAVESVSNPGLKEMLVKIFTDETVADAFKKHPGAIEIHHNWIGGLLEHTLEVLKFSLLAHELYPQLDRDLLIAGSLLHDIGKLEEIEVTSRIKGTKRGQLAGHLMLSAIYVSRKLDEAKIDIDVKDRILHIIASHHGRNEYGSPKEPMFPEAFVVYYADELSAKTSEMVEFVESAREGTEDEFMYNKRSGKNILLR